MGFRWKYEKDEERWQADVTGEFMIRETQMMRNERFLKNRIPDKPPEWTVFFFFRRLYFPSWKKEAVMQNATGEQNWTPIVADMTAIVT